LNHTFDIKKIAIIGQGYVGLPLAIELAFHFPVVGFDIDIERIEALKRGNDQTNEADFSRMNLVLRSGPGSSDIRVNSKSYEQAGLTLSSDWVDVEGADVFIVTVPTPIDEKNFPNLTPLKDASRMIGRLLKPGGIVIYESTVYPGCTEEECVPLLEEESRLVFNQDFFVGYSPERVNPGDKVNTLTTIVKVTSGSTPEIADEVDSLYKKIIKAGTHKAPSIKIAEASKAIENAQRDLNISFMNELALIFDRIGIDTNDVIDAASTKFNFLKYKPGLVGGHCISVDPYYLTHKAIQLGYFPDVILSGRRVNNSIASFIVEKVIRLMKAKDIALEGAKILILGVTFKENCPDIRNTKVVDVYNELLKLGMIVDLYDPWADPVQVYQEYNLQLLTRLPGSEGSETGTTDHSEDSNYDAIILTTAHNEFLTLDLVKIKKRTGVVFDTKGVLPRSSVDARL